jgi:hypothetical protein
MVIRPAVGADFVAYNGSLPPYRVQAFVGEVDGKIVGIAGLAFPPGCPLPVVWSDMTDEARAHKYALHKAALRFMRTMPYRKVIAAASTEIDGSERWLRHLGFQPTGEVTDDGPVYFLMRE